MDARSLRAPGVRVVADPPGLHGYHGVYLLRLGEGCAIGAPRDVTEDIRRRADGCEPDDVFTPSAAQALVGERAALVLGPSVHAYLDAAMFVPQATCDARVLTADDGDAVEQLRASVDDAEWGEGGFARDMPSADVVWGAFEDGALIAAGNMTDFDGRPADVGVVTRPDVRGRGIGARLVSIMVADALRTSPVIRYRALATNTASLRVAHKLGFAPDGANIAVRLRT